MNYQETLDYLFSQLPMFQRIGAAAYKADLHNTYALCELLEHPEKKFKSIHVAGTNGKGSTSHMIASVLQSAGYKVGLYTSPHLKDFRERIKINGVMISEQNVVDFVDRYKTDFEKIQLSFFEMTVGLAFDYFAKEQVDVAVIEVGLGGRLDSTNVIHPLLSVITNISFDHVALLGDTLPKIAFEKAGIIKENIPVVIGEYDSETAEVFVKKAQEKNADLVFADKKFSLTDVKTITENGQHLLQMNVLEDGKPSFDRLQLDLNGIYQRKNILTVVAALMELKKFFNLSDDAIRSGLKVVKKQTGLLGRWQTISHRPLVITDTGHNEAGIREILKQIALTPHKELHMVIGMVNDKDIAKVLSMLPTDAHYYFCRAQIPRALPADELAEQANNLGLKGNAYPTVLLALKAAQESAHEDDLIFVGGSTFVAAEVV